MSYMTEKSMVTEISPKRIFVRLIPSKEEDQRFQMLTETCISMNHKETQTDEDWPTSNLYELNSYLLEEMKNLKEQNSKMLKMIELMNERSAKEADIKKIPYDYTEEGDDDDDEDQNEEEIGLNGTLIPIKILKNIDWTSYMVATRKLLEAVFDRKTLATHSMTGKKTGAHIHIKASKQLNPYKVQDIVKLVSKSCNVSEKAVRKVVTAKCNDEKKSFNRIQRNSSKNDL